MLSSLCCDPGKPRLFRIIAQFGRSPVGGDVRIAAAVPASEVVPLPIDGRADIGPDRFDLVRLQDAVPRRHVVLAADDRLDKTIVVVGAQASEVERRPACKSLQLLAMTTRAAVVIE